MLQALKRFLVHTVKKSILRQRYLNKHCLLRFFWLNIKIPPPHVPQGTLTTHTHTQNGSCRTFVVKYIFHVARMSNKHVGHLSDNCLTNVEICPLPLFWWKTPESKINMPDAGRDGLSSKTEQKHGETITD